jgi:RiboL-PSP-HEPN
VTPLDHFTAVWIRCSHLSAAHAFLSKNTSAALRPEEILRAEWVARVSALDLYVHKLVASRMLRVFEGALPPTQAYLAFRVPTEVLRRIQSAKTPADASAAFELEVRRQLGFVTYQLPEAIADGVRLTSDIELWNEVAAHQGASQGMKVKAAKAIKQTLAAIVDRRNKIAHEGDIQPALPIAPWPIAQSDLVTVSDFIHRLVNSIDSCVS